MSEDREDTAVHPKPPQQVRDELSELRGLLVTHKGIITGDIGPVAYGLVIDCVTAQRDKIPIEHGKSGST